MITTDFLSGAPCWLDLGVPDVPAAAAFYGAVFGWELESKGEHGGIFRLGGRRVGALGRLSEEGARAAWMIYFGTPDARATTEAVEKAGGTVRVAPREANWGVMAQFTDPYGGQFAVWQRGEQVTGLEAVDEPGTLSWVELYTTDAAGTREFYGGLFDWQTQEIPLPQGGGGYTMITPAGQPAERMFGGFLQLDAKDLTLTGGRSYWHPVFGSTDTDATLAHVTAHGGTVQMGPADAPGVGRLAVCVDPFGADFVVLTPAARA